MCGIFALLNNNGEFSSKEIERAFYEGNSKKRGPDHSSISKPNNKVVLGFHRLAINGLNPESNQPIVIDNISLICNGEIYNYRELYALMGAEPETQSDCEVIIHLYKKYGIEQTLQMLDGVFAFVLTDNRIVSDLPVKMYIARDPYGVRPLYYLRDMSKRSGIFAFASDIKTLSYVNEPLEKRLLPHEKNKFRVEDFPPGHFAEFELGWTVNASWTIMKEEKYHTTGFNSNILMNKTDHTELINVVKNIQTFFMAAVLKRCCATEKPIACLLSGGLDSSLVTAIVAEFHKLNGMPPVETYSIGIEGSEDLKYAKIAADYLGTKHTEIIVEEKDFIDAVPHVIHDIGSYDTTTVRASIGNWLVGKYIAEHSEAKVIFNGDGSDELCGGYIYMHKCPDAIEFDRECRRLLGAIHKFDVLRSDRCISSHGLEPRTPFLDRSWVQYYLSILPDLRFHVKNGLREKYLLRTAFSPEYLPTSDKRPLLPDEILWRRKEAFSDGVTGTARSLYQILEEHAKTRVDELYRFRFSYLPAETAEQYWYRYEFTRIYGSNFARLLPYYWMPRYVEAKDASARTLDIYAVQRE
jgi:asparagine synthase (glutamine-hydrolysing)